MPTGPSALPERRRALVQRDHHGCPAHPEAGEWGGVADQLAAEAWSDLDWEE